MKDLIAYIFALYRINFKIITERPKTALLFSAGMFVQDTFFFSAWIVFFGAVGTVRGWGLPEIFLLYGIIFCDYGFSVVMFNGIRHLGYKILDGELDVYLTRPRNPLPALFIARCNPGGFGDIVLGLIFLGFFAGLSFGQFCLAVIAAMMVAALFESMKLIFYSLNFFFNNGARFGDYLTDTLYYLTTVPQQSQSPIIKGILFTIMPAGFIALVPMKLARAESPFLLGALAVVIFIYVLIGIGVFNCGVRRYKRQGAA